MLDVLHCVLIDSPEALNMMKVSIYTLKSIICDLIIFNLKKKCI
jgi:hypothetical protein